MSRKVFRFPPGVCSCILEHSYRDAQLVGVVRASRAEALLEPVPGVNEGDCLSVSVKFNDGRKVPLLARVRAVSAKGVILRWLYNQPYEETQLEAMFGRYAAGAGTSPSRPAGAGSFREDAILSRALTVEAKELAARHEQLHVLGMATIKELIEDAVSDAVESLTRSVPEDQKKRLLEEAEESFNAKLASIRAEKADLEARSWKLQHQLEQAQRVLGEERNRVIQAEKFTVSEDGLTALESRFSRLLERALKRGGVDPKLEKELQGIFDRLLDGERQRISSQVRDAHSDSIALLERKVTRLARTLEEAERERDLLQRHAAALEAAGTGMRGTVMPGLADDDPAKEKKLELLKQIVEQNKEMRSVLAARGKLPAGRRERAARAPRPTGPAAAAGGAPAAAEPAAPSPPASAPPAVAADGSERSPAGPPRTAVGPISGATTQHAATGGGGGGSDGDETGTEVTVAPDDLPWEPPPAVEDDAAEYTESGIKRIRVERVKPPPLERTG